MSEETPTSSPGRPIRPAYRPVRTPLMSMGPSLEEERRRHKLSRIVAISSVLGVAAIVTLIWLVGVLGREVVSADPALTAVGGASGTGAAAAVEKSGKPTPQTLAEAIVDPGVAGLRLQLPIRREAVTGIGFAPRHERGVIELDPAGERANTSWLRRATQRFLSTAPAGDLRWYRLADGTPSMVVIGALPGTEAYAPIDGTVQAISPYVLDGETRGALIQLQPVGDGQTLVITRNIDPDPDLRVGSTVSQGSTRLGTVRDMQGVIAAPLAAYTHDSGSGIDMYVLRTNVQPTFRG